MILGRIFYQSKKRHMRKRDIKENKKYDRWCTETLRKVDIGEFSGKIEKSKRPK